MPAHVEMARAPSESEPGMSLADHAARQLDRAKRLHSMANLIGITNTAKIILDRLASTHLADEHEIDLDGGSVFRHPLLITTAASDLHGYHEIAKEKVYELPSEIEDDIDGSPIVDLGAYIGMSAAYFATRYPHSSILAVEPYTRNYRLLDANATRYGGRIRPEQAAFALNRGRATMVHNDPPGASHMSNVFLGAGVATGETGTTVTAESITPEDILHAIGSSARIGILKVDIEGAESPIFSSTLIDPLLQRTDILMIETHDRFEAGKGSSDAVEDATSRNGLELADFSNGHTATYAR